ncbi:hypothetical protein NQ176_g3079 [Zarea fungicola]|uniref:Uncharacterized protein n=1 Tax=Zarea fungicola TaxID=93591 RepID=A0ACC1NMB2_9HYPO|nr:hypothetical protein NQ176_g3079 [Lecanicillium fungicola]
MRISALCAIIIGTVTSHAAKLGICSSFDVNTGGCKATTCKLVDINFGQTISIPDLHLAGSSQKHGVPGIPAACFFHTVNEPAFELQLKGANGQSARLSSFVRTIVGPDFNWVVAGPRAQGHAGFPVTSIKQIDSPPVTTTRAL